MPKKTIYLFDSSNSPLHVKGIRIELFDVSTGTLLATQDSDDLNPGTGGRPSNEWGVQLDFTACGNAVDVYFCDPAYRYPGSIIRNLNGQVTDRVDVDLLRLPTGLGGQAYQLSSPSPASIDKWVRGASKWTEEEKQAVRTVVTSFSSVIVPILDELHDLTDLQRVAANWAETLERVGISHDVLLQ